MRSESWAQQQGRGSLYCYYFITINGVPWAEALPLQMHVTASLGPTLRGSDVPSWSLTTPLLPHEGLSREEPPWPRLRPPLRATSAFSRDWGQGWRVGYRLRGEGSWGAPGCRWGKQPAHIQGMGTVLFLKKFIWLLQVVVAACGI